MPTLTPRLSAASAALAVCFAAGVASAQPLALQGELAEGDDQLNAGEFVDRYTHSVNGPVRLTIEMASDAVDTYLWVIGPTQDSIHNDDVSDEDDTRSVITVDYPAQGEWAVWATSFAAGEAGPYQLTITEEPLPALSLENNLNSALAEGDQQLETKEYYDLFTIQLEAGQTLLVDMLTTEFDPYLIVLTPDGERFENDDHATRNDLSRVVLQAQVAGEYRIVPTSFAPEVQGRYELFMRTSEAPRAAVPAGRAPKS